MRITWYGHASFLIEADDLRIILDPYRSPDSGGYAPIAEGADVVVVSHENDRYHSHLGQITPPFRVVRAPDLPPGGEVVLGVRFEAIPVFETPEKLPGDEVALVHFRLGGLRVGFLGDLGHPLDEAELAPLRGLDVALVPAGGPPTIALDQIPTLLDAIAPRVVVPMHYKTPGIDLKIEPVERFFEALPGWPVERLAASWFELTHASLPPGRTIVVPASARL